MGKAGYCEEEASFSFSFVPPRVLNQCCPAATMLLSFTFPRIISVSGWCPSFKAFKRKNHLNISFPKGNETTSLCNLILTFRFLHLAVLLENTQHQVPLEEFSEYRKQIKLALLTRSHICQGTWYIWYHHMAGSIQLTSVNRTGTAPLQSFFPLFLSPLSE